jgi:ABC-type Zn uptake system ZnuABC Zn-binding protein ZnuA
MKIHWFAVILSAFFFSPLSAAEPIPVVTTLPVLKEFVEQIGGKQVSVRSLITGLESEHTYTPKPSDLIAIRKAKLLVKIGLGLESWLNSLIENGASPDLRIITTSNGVPLLFGGGHGHGADKEDGNPHIWLDPENVKIMIRPVTEELARLDPSHQTDYRKNEAALIVALNELTREMIAKVAELPARGMVTHHPAWPYFARRFGFSIYGEIQMQAGSEPSARQIGALIQLIRKEKVGVILSEPQLNPKIPQILAEETGARLVILSPLPGVIPGTNRYADLIRYNVETLANALRKGLR